MPNETSEFQRRSEQVQTTIGYVTSTDQNWEVSRRWFARVEDGETHIQAASTCARTGWHLIDWSGRSRTNSDSIYRWVVDDHLCDELIPSPWVINLGSYNFIATAETDQPVFLTSQPDMSSALAIIVHSWTVGGDPSPLADFSWRIRMLVAEQPV